MHYTTVMVPIRLPLWLYRVLWSLKKKLNLNRPTNSTLNLLGDRDIEWSWVASRIPDGPGEALDFGNGGSPLALLAAQRGFNVVAVDLNAIAWPYTHPTLKFSQGDIINLSLPQNHYNL